MPKIYFSKEDKQITDIQRYIVGTRKQKRISQEVIAKALGKTRAMYSIRESDMSQMKLIDFLITLHEIGLDLEIKEET